MKGKIKDYRLELKERHLQRQRDIGELSRQLNDGMNELKLFEEKHKYCYYLRPINKQKNNCCSTIQMNIYDYNDRNCWWKRLICHLDNLPIPHNCCYK